MNFHVQKKLKVDLKILIGMCFFSDDIFGQRKVVAASRGHLFLEMGKV